MLTEYDGEGEDAAHKSGSSTVRGADLVTRSGQV